MDLACSGETTASMLNGPDCAPAPVHLPDARGPDLPPATPSSVALITIDIGGNDVVNCVSSHGNRPTVRNRRSRHHETNLTSMLTQLQQAAAPWVPIIGMNYFDPFLGDWLAGGAGTDSGTGHHPGPSEPSTATWPDLQPVQRSRCRRVRRLSDLRHHRHGVLAVGHGPRGRRQRLHVARHHLQPRASPRDSATTPSTPAPPSSPRRSRRDRFLVLSPTPTTSTTTSTQ